MQTRTAEGASASIPRAGVRLDWSWTILAKRAPVRHRDLAPIYRLWFSKCGRGTLPRFSDFSEDELTPWIGRLSIVHAAGSDFEVELWGCCITDQHGHDRTRVKLSQAKTGPVGANAREMFETVTEMGVAALPCGGTHWQGRPFHWHGIVLPLAGRAALTCLFPST